MKRSAIRARMDSHFSALRVISSDAPQGEGGCGDGRVLTFGAGGHRRSFEIEETTLLRLIYRPASEPAAFLSPRPAGCRFRSYTEPSLHGRGISPQHGPRR